MLIAAVAVEARQSTPRDQTQSGRGGTQQFASVPDLFGRTDQEARGLLEKAKLTVGEVTRAEANFEPGTVFRQQYAAGTRLKPGTAVGYILAMRVRPPPVKTTTVPDLFGATEAKARDLLESAGLRTGRVTSAEDRARPGTVFRQQYGAGQKVEVGTAVGFVLALQVRPPPEKPATVPDLSGATEDQARNLLKNARLSVGEVTTGQARVRAFTVFRQQYAAGTQLKPGTSVWFVLAEPMPPDRGGGGGSRPPPVKPAIVPDLIGATENLARTLLLDAGLRIGDVTTAPARVKAFTVVKQEYAAGTELRPGTTVWFVLAEPMPPDRGGRGGGGGGNPPPVNVPVPDLLGASENNARTRLVNAGLQVGEVTRAQATEKPDTVFKQGYPAGALVAPGTPVGFVVAAPITVEVPPVVGNPRDTAVAILRKSRLQAGTIREEPSRSPKGQVLTQGISPGTQVPVGSVVDLTVAIPIPVTVPALRLLPESNAVALLKKLELTIGDITTEESRQREGTVVSQQPSAGTVVDLGTRVTFVVARPITVEVPPLVNRSAEDAAALLRKLGLTVGNVTSEESRRDPDTVLSQTPAAGARVTIGSAVGFVTARAITVLVPNVVSLPEADARQALIARELAIGSVTVEEARVAPGSILRQSPVADRRVTIRTPIDLVTARPVTVRVPRIAGLKESAAAAALVSAELKPGRRFQESPVEPGTVLSQAIEPGTRVDIETVVDFVVSAVETVLMPSVTGISKEEARQRLIAGRLSVGSEPVRPVRSESRGIVLEQSVDAGARVAVGTAIVLTVSTPEMVAVPRVIDQPRSGAFTSIASAGLKVGEVSRAISFTRSGGTIVGQGLTPGSQVEFGTAVAVQEALPRIVWAGPTTGLMAVAGLLEMRRRRKKKIRTAEHPGSNRPVPPLDVSATPHVDLGQANVRTEDPQPIRVELRIVPTADSGTQDIAAVSGDIIKGERRP